MVYFSLIFLCPFNRVLGSLIWRLYFFSFWINFIQFHKYLLILHYVADSLQKEYKIEEFTEGTVPYQIICILLGEWNI